MDLARPVPDPTTAVRDPAGPRDGGRADERRRLLAHLVVALVVLVPLDAGWVLWAGPDGATDFNRRVTIAPFDFVLAAFVWQWLVHRRASWSVSRSRSAARSRSRVLARFGEGPALGAAFALVYVVAFAAHPSWRGVELAVRLLAGAGIVDVVRSMPRGERRRVCIAFAGVGAFEAVLAVAQSVHGRGFALFPIDQEGPLFAFGGEHAGRGGLSHPYHLAVYLVLAVLAAVVGGRDSTGRERRLWMAATFLVSGGLAVTFSRAMVLALVPAAAMWGVEHRRRIGYAVRPILLALVGGLVVAGLAFSSGWTTRAAQTTGSGADRGRAALARAGLEMAHDSPVVGVGPGNYVLALAEPGGVEGELLPSHNLVVQAAAELGVAGAVCVGVLALWFVRRTTRRGLLAGAALWLLTPFFLLDSYVYAFPTGLLLAALWIGLLESDGVLLVPDEVTS